MVFIFAKKKHEIRKRIQLKTPSHRGFYAFLFLHHYYNFCLSENEEVVRFNGVKELNVLSEKKEEKGTCMNIKSSHKNYYIKVHDSG